MIEYCLSHATAGVAELWIYSGCIALNLRVKTNAATKFPHYFSKINSIHFDLYVDKDFGTLVPLWKWVHCSAWMQGGGSGRRCVGDTRGLNVSSLTWFGCHPLPLIWTFPCKSCNQQLTSKEQNIKEKSRSFARPKVGRLGPCCASRCRCGHRSCPEGS